MSGSNALKHRAVCSKRSEYTAGYVRGRDEGQERVNQLIRILAEQNRINDITRAASDKAYQEKLFEEMGI